MVAEGNLIPRKLVTLPILDLDYSAPTSNGPFEAFMILIWFLAYVSHDMGFVLTAQVRSIFCT